MEPVNLLLVGCGMMGARHVRGMGELEQIAPGSVRLLGVCDRREEAAQKVAVEAEKLLGSRPAVFTDVEQALAGEASIQAADVVTDPRSHDELVVGLLEAGLDVICEKPLALTVARGRRMIEAAQRTGAEPPTGHATEPATKNTTQNQDWQQWGSRLVGRLQRLVGRRQRDCAQSTFSIIDTAAATPSGSARILSPSSAAFLCICSSPKA